MYTKTLQVQNSAPPNNWNVLTNGVLALSQPNMMLEWAAVNDHPADKALFDFEITAAKKETIVVNGERKEQSQNSDGTITNKFHIGVPTATYLIVLAIGNYELIEGEAAGNVRVRHYLAPNTDKRFREALQQTAAMLKFFSEKIGPYPFGEYGVLVPDFDMAIGVETQTLATLPIGWEQARPEYLEETLAHELAHQWFAAMVTYKDNSQTFIHEGIAQYLGWLWTDQRSPYKKVLEEKIRFSYPFAVHGGEVWQTNKYGLTEEMEKYLPPEKILTVDQIRNLLDAIFGDSLPKEQRFKVLAKVQNGMSVKALTTEFSNLQFFTLNIVWWRFLEALNACGANIPNPEFDAWTPPAAIQKNPFNGGVYDRGAMTLHALRLKVGNEIFWRILKTFLERHKFANANNQDFLNVVGELGDEAALSQTKHWLFDERVPDFPELKLFSKDFPLGTNFLP